jgi:hypothetical protein
MKILGSRDGMLDEPLWRARGIVMAIAALGSLLGFRPALTLIAAQQTEDAVDQQKDQPTDANTKKRFTFGGRVEVLALGTHDLNDPRWWAEDGKPLASLPAPLVGCFVRQSDERGKPLASLPITWKMAGQVASADPVWRRIIFRINNLPDDARVTWKIIDSRATGSGEVTVDGEQAPKGYFTRYFGTSAEQKTFSVKVGVAAGEWTATAKARLPFETMAIGMQGKGIVFSGTFDTRDGAVVIVSHDFSDQDFRLVAVDKRGTTHVSASSSAGGAGKIFQMRGTYPNLKADDIDRFEFQTRNYEFVEISGLPLDPPKTANDSR